VLDVKNFFGILLKELAQMNWKHYGRILNLILILIHFIM